MLKLREFTVSSNILGDFEFDSSNMSQKSLDWAKNCWKSKLENIVPLLR